MAITLEGITGVPGDITGVTAGTNLSGGGGTGTVTISMADPLTSMVTLRTGAAGVGTAPLKFVSGTLNTAPEAGAVEFLTDAYYATITTGAARKTLAFLESPSFTTPNIGAALGTSLALGADPADAGAIRLENAAVIAWEASPAGTDVTLTVDASEIMASSVPFSATTGFRIGGAAAAGVFLRGDATNFVASTTTIPDTFAISTIPYASAANVLSALATANYGILNTSATGVPSIATAPVVSGNITTGVAGVATGALKIAGTTSGTFTLTTAAAAGTVVWTAPTGGSTDFSATGATGAFVKQASAGAALTVAVPTVGELGGLGANVATALAIAIGSAGAPVTFDGAGGTPSSITLTNAGGTAASLTAGLATDTVSKTGTGSTYATSAGPTFTAPVLGAATGTSLALNSSSGVPLTVTQSQDVGDDVTVMRIQADRATPTANDDMDVRWAMSNSAGTQTDVFRQKITLSTATAGSEMAKVEWLVINNGTLTELVDFDPGFQIIQFNDAGIDIDFSVMWDSGTAFFVEGSTGKFGIGTNTPAGALATIYRNNTSTASQLSIQQDGTGDASVGFLVDAQNWSIGVDNTDNSFKIKPNVDLGSGNGIVITTGGDISMEATLTVRQAVISGVAGANLGQLKLSGDTSGTITIQPLTAAGTWTLTLPPDDGDAGEQLQTNGAGVTTWEAAASKREYKNILRKWDDPQTALDAILRTPVYDFKYNPEKRHGTGDYETTYTGVMADEAPFLMHFNGGIVNPVSSLGYWILSVKALNNKIEFLQQEVLSLKAQAMRDRN